MFIGKGMMGLGSTVWGWLASMIPVVFGVQGPRAALRVLHLAGAWCWRSHSPGMAAAAGPRVADEPEDIV